MIRKILDYQVAICSVLYPTPPKPTSSSTQADIFGTQVVDRGTSRSYQGHKSREPSRPQSYYDPSPGYSAMDKGAPKSVVQRPEQIDYYRRPSEKSRGYHVEDATYRTTAPNDRHYDDNWTLNDSVLNPQEFYKLSPTYWGGFRDMLATECIKLLQRRADEFGEFEYYARGLERDVSTTHHR